MVELKCFHGTSKECAKLIIEEQRFNHSEGGSRRLGSGAYFFNQMGSSPDYTKLCARELRRHKYLKENASRGYSIISCVVKCEDNEFLDLYQPDVMEAFHKMRYALHERNLQADSSFKYENASQADTQVIEELKRIKRIAIIRAPQFFGMFEKEQRMEFSGKRISQNPRTFIPNVINLCVDTNLVQICNIEIVEEGEFDAEHELFMG